MTIHSVTVRPAQRIKFDPIPSEDELIQAWPDSIRPEDRRSNGRQWVGDNSPDQSKKRAEARRIAQLAKQKAFAAECVPVRPGDEELIRLYGEGITVEKIARDTRRCKKYVRQALIACHPDLERLS